MTTEIQVRQTLLRRAALLAERAPGVIGYGEVKDHRQHQLKSRVRCMEKRGEIRALRGWTNPRTGVTYIPYLRYKTVGRVRLERAARVGAVVLIGFVAAVGVGWAVWSIRWFLLVVAALSVLAWLRYGRHWRSGCPGLHCESCGGR